MIGIVIAALMMGQAPGFETALEPKAPPVIISDDAAMEPSPEMKEEMVRYANIYEGIRRQELAQSLSQQIEFERDRKVKSAVRTEATPWNTFEATAYTAFCDTGCTGITATGLDVSTNTHHEGKRIIAVDPNIIPLGSTVEIQIGSETFKGTAQDTGGAIKGHRVDILYPDKTKARKFGRRAVKIRILEEE